MVGSLELWPMHEPLAEFQRILVLLHSRKAASSTLQTSGLTLQLPCKRTLKASEAAMHLRIIIISIYI